MKEVVGIILITLGIALSYGYELKHIVSIVCIVVSALVSSVALAFMFHKIGWFPK